MHPDMNVEEMIGTQYDPYPLGVLPAAWFSNILM